MKTKKPAHEVKRGLTRDVNSILAGFIHEVEEAVEYTEKHLDVDAIVEGRVHKHVVERQQRLEARERLMNRPPIIVSRGSFIPALFGA